MSLCPILKSRKAWGAYRGHPSYYSRSGRRTQSLHQSPKYFRHWKYFHASNQ